MHVGMADEANTAANDPVYSLAENVRRVAGTGERKDPSPALPKAKARTVPKKEKAPQKAALKTARTATRIMAVSKGKEQIKKESRESEKKAETEEEYITITPGWFWKASTVVLAILVIWAYFFR